MKSSKFVNKNVSISPQKMLVIANMIKNEDAILILEKLNISSNVNKPIRLIHKILKSGYKQFVDKNKDKLEHEKSKIFVDYIKIDKGIIKKKVFFRAKGRSDVIRNRKANVTVSFSIK
jgi:ribosomal protein L22